MRSHEKLAALARGQHGVVSGAQLRGLGFPASAISRAKGARRLHMIHQGVFAVGHATLSQHGRCSAAVLACGAGALLSHSTAAWLWGLTPGIGDDVDVTAPGNRHRQPGISVHRTSRLSPSEATAVDGIPTTSVPRTLLDFAADARQYALQNAVEKAERLGLLQIDEVDATLAVRPGTRGAGRLRRAVEIYRDPMFSRARSERLFLDLVKRAGLVRPSMNIYVEGHEIDAYWEAERFAVEIDGWGSHRTRRAFERDPVRQEDLKLAGIDSIRLTARRIEKQPREVGRRLGDLLEQRRLQLEPRPPR